MTVYLILIYQLNATPQKLPRNYLIELDKLITKIYMEKQICKDSQENTEKEKLREELALPDIKIYYKASVIKSVVWAHE